jgi:hypothetical protein
MKDVNDKIEYEIRQVLLNNWDPFHVHNSGGNEHDYDQFIPKLHRYIKEHRSIEKVSEYLLRAETDVFKLRGSTQKDFHHISDLLLKIKL